jgi:predicted ABC-type transport system involved in lysophospholipase L1 biosynthesis ATPase subunit
VLRLTSVWKSFPRGREVVEALRGVDLNGRDLGEMSARARAGTRRRDTGFVFQFFHLLPALTVRENVALPLVLDRRLDRAGAARVDGLLADVGLIDRADHLPAELSGGEMQRAAIARALVAEPALVLADEPTGNLDAVTGDAVLDLLIETVRRRQTALVMVTHDAAAAARADRVLTLADGHLS